jgi:hypothetical protein
MKLQKMLQQIDPSFMEVLSVMVSTHWVCSRAAFDLV